MRRSLFFRLALVAIVLGVALWPAVPTAPVAANSSQQAVLPAPVLTLDQAVTQEPLLGGDIAYTLTFGNQGETPIADKGYNLTITDTLSADMHFVSADPPVTFVTTDEQSGTTTLVWDNLADLEVNEELDVTIIASLDAELTLADTVSTTVQAALNTVPDNSGAWVRTSSSLQARPQALDIEMQALQSTGDEQASGAGEYPVIAPGSAPAADWSYRYRLTVQNNAVGTTEGVEVVALLPPGVAYLGNPTITAGPASASATPVLALQDDGALELRWTLGDLTTAQYTNPLEITFDAAVPYRYRSAADTVAASGPYAGPMSGSIIPEDRLLLVNYEASGTYVTPEDAEIPTSDGSKSTPADDPTADVVAEYLTVRKRATPGTVGIGDTVTFDLDFFVSEYYTLTDVLLTDVLPDGMTYVMGSATQEPRVIQTNTPGTGQTTLIWDIPTSDTTPGSSGTVRFQATVDPTYEAPAYAGEPVVSGDNLTNRVTISGDWQDAVDPQRSGTVNPDISEATVQTRMPTFGKQVWQPDSQTWGNAAQGFTGDTMRFRLSYRAAEDIDAKGVVIRDFLPRGMRYVADSASHTVSGTFSDGPGCTSAPQQPTIGSLNGLQYLEWKLCSTERGSLWQATIEATISDMPNAQPGWIVANFGKLSGQNTYGDAYSLRELARVEYVAPELVLSKQAQPATNLEAGDPVDFTIAVTNEGDAPAYNLVVSDTLPPDLLVANTGGSGSPVSSSYTTSSGDPASGAGGLVQWSSIASLEPGATQTFRYSASIPGGLPAGQQMTNIASVAYNSRADNTGHQWAATDNPEQPNAAEETVYVRGLSISKTADRAFATIGEVVQWTLTIDVPPGVVAYWPVLEESDLPAGFDYIPGSTQIQAGTLPVLLDTAHHPQNPQDNGKRDLRWYLQTIDNSQGSTADQFTITFDTLVTGVQGTDPTRSYYPDNCCLSRARNTARIGWYDTAGGYNGQGHAYGASFSTSNIDRRSPPARFDVQVRQPSLVLSQAVEQSLVGAGNEVLYTLQVTNLGNERAHDILLTDVLPEGVQFLATESMDMSYPFSPAPAGVQPTDANTSGSSNLEYGLNTLYVGATWTIVLRAQIDPAISADLDLVSTATIESYSSQPGTPPDSNGDGLPDERTYRGPTATTSINTPQASIEKELVTGGELPYGGEVVYSLRVPATPIQASLYDVVITDTIDSHLQIQQVQAQGGSTSTNGQEISIGFDTIPAGEQREVRITAVLPADSAAQDGTLMSNRAYLRHRNGEPQESNQVASSVVAPALVVNMQASQPVIEQGDGISYTLSIANMGSGRAAALVATMQLPAGLDFVSGSALLDGQPLPDPSGDLSGGTWNLPDLAGGATHTITFAARVAQVTTGSSYAVTASANGQDSAGQPIPSDNSRRVPADSDPTDSAQAVAYGGPLESAQWSTFVAYEDLKKTGWSDWDYNDLVVRIDIEQQVTPAGDLAVLRLRYEALARGAGFDHALMHDIPLVGGGRSSLTVFDAQGESIHNEHAAFGEDTRFSIFSRTKAALPESALPPEFLPERPFVNTIEEQPGTIPGYTADLLIVLDDATANPTRTDKDGRRNLATTILPLPWDPYIKVYDTGEEVHLVIPGHLDNMQEVNSIYNPNSPLLGHDLPLAHIFDPTWHWPIEYEGIWMGYPGYVGYVNSGGRGNRQWFDSGKAEAQWLWHFGTALRSAPDAAPQSVSPTSVYFASPLVADLDGSGEPAIMIGNLVANQMEGYDASGAALPGWPQSTAGGIKAAAAVADLDGDNDLEIVAGDSTGLLYAWHHDGQAVAGWPVQVGSYRVLATPAIADIDGGGPDIVLPLADGRLYAFNADGTPKAGWPVSIGDVADRYGSQVINSSPRIADLDGNGSPEIVVGSTDSTLYVFSSAGELRWSYASGDMVLSTPAVADIDPARPGLEVAFGSGDGAVYLLDKDGGLLWRNQTGWTVRSSPLVVDMDDDGDLEIICGSDDDLLYAWHHDGQAVAGWPQQTEGDIFSSPASGDIDGDGVAEIVVGSDDARIYAWEHDGTPLDGWPQAASASVKGSPALANLDSDAALEVTVGDFSGTLYRLLSESSAVKRVYLPLVVR